MWSTPSLPSLPGPLWSGVVAPDRVLSMSQIELNCVLMLNWIVWNRTVYMYKNVFSINNLQWLTYHKTKPNNHIDARALNDQLIDWFRPVEPSKGQSGVLQSSWQLWLPGQGLLSYHDPVLKHYKSPDPAHTWPHCLCGVLPHCRGAVSIFYCPRQQVKL